MWKLDQELLLKACLSIPSSRSAACSDFLSCLFIRFKVMKTLVYYLIENAIMFNCWIVNFYIIMYSQMSSKGVKKKLISMVCHSQILIVNCMRKIFLFNFKNICIICCDNINDKWLKVKEDIMDPNILIII